MTYLIRKMDLDSEEEYLAEVFGWSVDTDVGDHLSEFKCDLPKFYNL